MCVFVAACVCVVARREEEHAGTGEPGRGEEEQGSFLAGDAVDAEEAKWEVDEEEFDVFFLIILR